MLKILTQSFILLSTSVNNLSSCFKLSLPSSSILGLGIIGSKDKGYRALTNIGDDGGQEVPHLHFHVFAGEKIGKMVN